MGNRHWALVLVILLTVASAAWGETPPAVSTTTDDPRISLENLRLKLKPLTQEELIVEADAWRDLLKAKVAEISRLQIQSKTKADAEKELMMKQLTALREERTGLADRVNTVIGELAAKGGKTEVYDQYVKAVSGLEVSSDDAFSNIETIRGWLTSKEGGIRWLMNAIKFLAVLLVFKIIAGLVGGVTRRSLSKAKLSALLKDFIVNTVQKTLFILGLIVALAMLEVNIGPLLAGIGVVGFVVGFALQNTLSNFAAGFMILMYRPYDIGDFVSAGGVTGTVDSMNLVSTSVKTPDNQTVIVPNSNIWGGVITNVTGNETRRLDLVFGIGYDDDIQKTQAVLEDIVKNHPLVLPLPEPVIRLHELADSSVNFVVRPWVKTKEYWNIYWDITRTVKERFDAEGISIPYPQRDVHLYQTAE